MRFLLLKIICESTADLEAENGTAGLGFWEELPCGICSMSLDARGFDGCLVAEVKKHEWTDATLKQLIIWERTCVEPGLEELHTSRCKTLMVQPGMQSAYSDILPSESG